MCYFRKTMLISLVVLFAGIVFAVPPKYINYQGKLTDTIGVAIIGDHDIEFKIYDIDTGGTPLWSEYHSDVTITKGLFDVILGRIDTLDLPFDTLYYLELVVDSEILSPRVLFTATPYAFYSFYSRNALTSIHADTATYATYASSIPDTIYGNSSGMNGVLTIIDTSFADSGVGLVIGNTGGPGIYINNSGAEGLIIEDSEGIGALITRPGGDGLEIVASDGTVRGIYIHADPSDTMCAPDTGLVIRDACFGADITGDVHIDGDLIIDGSITYEEGPRADSLYILNQDTTIQKANFRISGIAQAGTLRVEEIDGQGFLKLVYSGSEILIDTLEFITLFSGTYSAGGTGSAVQLTFSGTFDDRAKVSGATMEVQLIRDPGETSEMILTSQRMIMVNTQLYSEYIVTLSAMDMPSAGNHTYAVRAKAVNPLLIAGRFIGGNLQLMEIKR